MVGKQNARPTSAVASALEAMGTPPTVAGPDDSRSNRPVTVDPVRGGWLDWCKLPTCDLVGKGDAHSTSEAAKALKALGALTAAPCPGSSRPRSPVVDPLRVGWLKSGKLPTCDMVGKQDAYPTSGAALDPVLLNTLASALPDGCPAPRVNWRQQAFDKALSRRLIGVYYGLGRSFHKIGDVDSSAIMYRTAVELGPDTGLHYRRACRALAWAYRRTRDRAWLDWLASALEAWPEAQQ